MITSTAILEAALKLIPNPEGVALKKWVDELRKENDDLRDEIALLKRKISDLSSPVKSKLAAPTCPNCSNKGRPYYMSPLPVDFVAIEGASHQCSQCGFKKNEN